MDLEIDEMADPCDVWEAEHRIKKNASGYYDPKSKKVYVRFLESIYKIFRKYIQDCIYLI